MWADIIVIANTGQSNGGGFGMSYATLPDHLKGGPIQGAFIFNSNASYWAAMTPGVNTGLPSTPGSWSAVTEVAYQITQAHPDALVLVVNVVRGERGVAEDPSQQDWSPNSDGELFDLTVDTIARAKAAFHAATGLDMPDPRVTIFTGMETDATDATKAAAAQDNLADLSTAIRADWMHDPHGAILATRVTDNPALAHSLAVRQGQWLADQADPDLYTIRTVGLPMQGEVDPHFAAAAHLEIGHSFFALGQEIGLW